MQASFFFTKELLRCFAIFDYKVPNSENNEWQTHNSAMKLRRQNTYKSFDVSIEMSSINISAFSVMCLYLLLAHVHQTTGKTTKDNNPLRRELFGEDVLCTNKYILEDGN